MLSQVKRTINKYKMLRPGDKVIVGVSGGADSICLLHVLLELKKGHGADIIVAHLDHGIRGREARRDSRFVKRAAVSLGLRFEPGQADVPSFRKESKLSLEEAARKLRYEFFERTRKKYKADKIATAHTLDDQAETVLMRLLRGSGAKGLSGIPPVSSGAIIRPLIETPRRDIETYLESRGIAWIEDSTNKLKTIQRNRIRLDLLPSLAAYNPQIKQTLARTSELMRIEDDFLDREAKKRFGLIFKAAGGELRGDLRKFRRVHQALRLGILRLALESLERGLKNISFLHIMAADEFLTSSGTASGEIELPDESVIAKGHDSFLVTTRPGLEREFSYLIRSTGKWRFPEFEVDVKKAPAKTLKKEREDVVYLDAGRVRFPIEVRSFRHGDRFVPLGMKGEKKLKNFFIDEKIPRFERHRVPVFTTGGRIFWIGGMRIDDRFKVRQKGEEALRLSIRFR